MAKRRQPGHEEAAPRRPRGRPKTPPAPDPAPDRAPEVNGTGPDPAFRAQVAEEMHRLDEVPEPAAYRPGNSRSGHGRLLRDCRVDAPSWFLRPLIPSSALTLVVGVPSSGKSTFGSWLCSEATRPAILPGREESCEVSLFPRLLAHGVDPDCCLILDERAWMLPQDRITLTEILRDHHTDLLWIDPIDSFVSIQSENDPDGVTEALEAFARLSREVGCAVVAARHPGKNLDNICPGSRKWRAVPREVIELRYEEGPPERRWLRCRKDPFHMSPKPHTYYLDGPDEAIRIFRLGDTVPMAQTKTWDVTDSADTWRIDEAEEFLRRVLRDGEQECRWVYSEAAKLGLSDRHIRYAARRLNVCVRHENSGREYRCLYPQFPPDPGTATVTGTP